MGMAESDYVAARLAKIKENNDKMKVHKFHTILLVFRAQIMRKGMAGMRSVPSARSKSEHDRWLD
jgi:hypothetical protein